jgi:hypothetical protein
VGHGFCCLGMKRLYWVCVSEKTNAGSLHWASRCSCDASVEMTLLSHQFRLGATKAGAAHSYE